MSAVKEPRTYGGVTGGARTARRRDQLVEAAFALVADDGWRAVTIEAVSRGAGLNKRYFYESFTTVDELIAAITQQLAADAIATTLGAIDDGATPSTAIRPAIAAFVTYLTDDPRRARVLFGAVPAADAAARHRAAAIREIIAAAASEGRTLHGAVDDAFLETTAAMLVGGTSQAVLDWLDGRIGSPRDDFVDHLVALWESVSELASRHD